MDDIQFWLYLLFAVIYFVSRALKKKDPKKTEKRTASRNSTPEERPQRKPVSFEELLQEFTEGRKPEVEEPEYEEEPAYEQRIEEPKREEEPVFEEGITRRFSDVESKRIYEESIAKAEGAEIAFQHDDDFKSKLQRTADKEQSSGVAQEIRDMLQNPNDARKAIVLGEILNRKY